MWRSCKVNRVPIGEFANASIAFNICGRKALARRGTALGARNPNSFNSSCVSVCCSARCAGGAVRRSGRSASRHDATRQRRNNDQCQQSRRSVAIVKHNGTGMRSARRSSSPLTAWLQRQLRNNNISICGCGMRRPDTRDDEAKQINSTGSLCHTGTGYPYPRREQVL